VEDLFGDEEDEGDDDGDMNAFLETPRDEDNEAMSGIE